jgi:hypothetical protein
MCPQIHFNIRKKALAKLNDGHWYEHVPKPVERRYEHKVIVTACFTLVFLPTIYVLFKVTILPYRLKLE